MSWVATTAASLGASEAALKLILGQLLGVPLMFLYRAVIAHRYIENRDTPTTWLIFIHQGKRTCNICFSSSLASWRVSGSLVETSFTPSMRLVSQNSFFSCSGDDVPL